MAAGALAQRVKTLNIWLQQKVVSKGGAIISATLRRLLASFITIESVWVYIKSLSLRKPRLLKDVWSIQQVRSFIDRVATIPEEGGVKPRMS